MRSPASDYTDQNAVIRMSLEAYTNRHSTNLDHSIYVGISVYPKQKVHVLANKNCTIYQSKSLKEKFTLQQDTKAQKGGVELEHYSFFNLGTGRGGWPTPQPGCFTPEKQIQYPLYMRLGGPQGCCRQDLIPGPSSK